MKIAFILPAIGKKPGEKYLRSWLMEPLTIAVLKALTPQEHTCVFYDDRVETVDYSADADLIAITVETYTAKRAYAMADRFRAAGKLVVMGGYHVTLLPQDARPHADILLRGNAEAVWAKMLGHVAAGNYQSEYTGTHSIAYGMPDRSIYADKVKKYLPVSLVEVGRGCRHDCSFCAIRSYYGGCYLHRSVEEIVAEIKTCPHKIFFFVDDSIFSDHAFARELFQAVKELHILWTTQVTLDIARDGELLRLMRESGCVMILIGFESIRRGNLAQMHKEWCDQLGERDQLVERIHQCGISIYASFVFGFDEDDGESFEQCLDFCERHGFFVAAFNHLLAFPGTETYRTFETEGRLISPQWWLEEGYTFGTISYTPKRLTPEELKTLCKSYKGKFYAFPSILRRGRLLHRRCGIGWVRLVYWVMNVLFHFEVDQRFGIPLGGNLDERRK